MLHLPTTLHQRFTRAQIAEMTRGAKVVRRKPKADLLVTLIAKADRILDNILEFDAAVCEAKQKLAKDDQGWPYTCIPDELLNVYWSNGFLFSSEWHIEHEFGKARRNLTAQLKHYRSRMKLLKPGHGMQNVDLEIRQGIASTTRKLALLKLQLEPMKKAQRCEDRRLQKIQRSVGLSQARTALMKHRLKLPAITKAIAASKPTTDAGALALILYVKRRIHPGCGANFADDSDAPGDFEVLLLRAHDFLSRKAT